MNNATAGFRDARSFIAGLLVGLSIVVPVFAMTVADPGDWPLRWILAAPVMCALGLVLHSLVALAPRRARMSGRGPRAMPSRFAKLIDEC